MANMNIRTPIFYCDKVMHQNGRGSTIASKITGSPDPLDFTTGSIGDLHDGKPLNLNKWTTKTNSTTRADLVLLNYNLGTSSWRNNFIAILNHNLKSADAKIRIFFGSTADKVNDVDGGSADTVLTSHEAVIILNCGSSISESGAGRSLHIEPANDGSTILQIKKSSDDTELTGYRYMGIQFEGRDGGTGGAGDFDASNDLTIGCIMIGETYTMPVAPDLSVKRSIIYDKVSIQESVGGQRYATATSLGKTASTTSKSPFTLSDYQNYAYGGRMAYDLNFSYLNSTDIMPTEYGEYVYTDETFVSDVWNITDGNMYPFIFSIDSTSTGSNAESEFLFARFAQNSLDMNQVAPDVFNMSLRIEEEF